MAMSRSSSPSPARSSGRCFERGENAEDAGKIAAQLERGAVIPGSRHQASLDAEFGPRPFGELFIQIGGGVRESSEHDGLAIARVDGVANLVRDQLLKVA